MKKIIVISVLFLFLASCRTSPNVTVSRTSDGRYELTTSNYYCNLYKNADKFSTFKNDSTTVVNETDVCNKCGQKFSAHETTSEHYQKDVTDKNWL